MSFIGYFSRLLNPGVSSKSKHQPNTQSRSEPLSLTRAHDDPISSSLLPSPPPPPSILISSTSAVPSSSPFSSNLAKRMARKRSKVLRKHVHFDETANLPPGRRYGPKKSDQRKRSTMPSSSSFSTPNCLVPQKRPCRGCRDGFTFSRPTIPSNPYRWCTDISDENPLLDVLVAKHECVGTALMPASTPLARNQGVVSKDLFPPIEELARILRSQYGSNEKDGSTTDGSHESKSGNAHQGGDICDKNHSAATRPRLGPDCIIPCC